jgi:PAT family beta-lactamase induction signal transducer AmpG
MVVGIPGLLMLARFVPPGVREPNLDAGEGPARVPTVSPALVARGVVATLLLLLGGALVVAVLPALSAPQGAPEAAFDIAAEFRRVWQPAAIAEWIQLMGIVVCAMIGGLLTVATQSRVPRPPRGDRHGTRARW